MIVDERMVTYIHSLEGSERDVIETIEQEALDTFVPIIRKETQSFLKVLMNLICQKIFNRQFNSKKHSTHYID